MHGAITSYIESSSMSTGEDYHTRNITKHACTCTPDDARLSKAKGGKKMCSQMFSLSLTLTHTHTHTHTHICLTKVFLGILPSHLKHMESARKKKSKIKKTNGEEKRKTQVM